MSAACRPEASSNVNLRTYESSSFFFSIFRAARICRMRFEMAVAALLLIHTARRASIKRRASTMRQRDWISKTALYLGSLRCLYTLSSPVLLFASLFLHEHWSFMAQTSSSRACRLALSSRIRPRACLLRHALYDER